MDVESANQFSTSDYIDDGKTPRQKIGSSSAEDGESAYIDDEKAGGSREIGNQSSAADVDTSGVQQMDHAYKVVEEVDEGAEDNVVDTGQYDKIIVDRPKRPENLTGTENDKEFNMGTEDEQYND